MIAGEERTPAAVDGLPLTRIVRPASITELQQHVCQAASEQQAIYAFGDGSSTLLGLPARHPGVGIDLRNLNQVIDYPARDMTITVQTGINFARLQEILAAENQWLPVDVPLADELTLGDALAANYSGARRYGFGTCRDYVIGISAVNDQGMEVKAGGRVVKNVAGYDLCKLYIGSLWTLGILTQATLKVRPRPQRSTLVGVDCPSSRLEETLALLHKSRTRPVCITLVNQRASAAMTGALKEMLVADREAWLMLVGFEDNDDAVAWQVEQVRHELRQEGLSARREWTDSDARPLWRSLADFPLASAAPLSVKLTVLPRLVGALCDELRTLPGEPSLQVHAGNGIVHAHLSPLKLEQAQQVLKRLVERATDGKGNVTIQRCPNEWKSSLPIWGAPRGDYALMREIKRKLDPNGIFNPGRFVDGI
jgi:glycolate oxidase FAD binding subunit